MASIYDFDVKDIEGNSRSMSDYRDKVLLIVNVASKCGFTPQYEGLEALHRKYHDKGLEVLGFPCDQFGHQEPGDEEAIKEFCSLNYGVTFDMFSKVDVNGVDADSLFVFLKRESPGLLGSEAIKWNFTKFLIGRDGKVIDRYAPQTAPASIAADIEELL